MTGARAPEDGFDGHSATNRACAIPGQATHYGRALRGERCRAPVPQCHWKTTTFVGALRLKAFLKKAAARTVDDLWNAIAQGIETFTPTECQYYFAAAGYGCE